jgi:hypothetical protein
MSAADPKDPGSWNRYGYAGGDPVNRSDPTGLDWVNGGGLWSIPSTGPGYCMGGPGLAFLPAEVPGWACLTPWMIAVAIASPPARQDCDPGWVPDGLMVTAYNGGQYSGSDIDFAARILFAESSTNQDERNAVASVEINQTNTRGRRTFTATGYLNEAVYDAKPKFTGTAVGQYEKLNFLNCASLRAAIETMVGTVLSGPSYPQYLYFRGGTVGSGDVHGAQRFFSRDPLSRR